MRMHLRRSHRALLAALVLLQTTPALPSDRGGDVTKFCRFQKGDTVAYGIVENDRVRMLSGDLFGAYEKTATTYALSEVALLVPTEPKHVFALAGNYKSHIGGEGESVTTVTTVTKFTTKPDGSVETDSNTATESRRSGDVPEKFQIPQPFLKSTASLLPHGGRIILPRDAEVVHYEAEMVVVIGKRARDVTEEQALDYVFGVTCGNDVSARVWQRNDVQWWRAKGADTFGPCGPFIATGLNYDDLLLQLRLNGNVRQQERTSQLIHNVAGTVSYLSRYTTLEPGDLIFTGTSGTTDAMKPGDVVEIELEGVGVLRNTVVAEQ